MGFDEAQYRISAAERMAEAGQTEDAVAVLKVITENERDEYDHSDRWNAAVTLSNIGENAAAAKAFLSLADDGGDYEYEQGRNRLEAAMKAAELGEWERAAGALLSIAEDKWIEGNEVRVQAAIEAAGRLMTAGLGAERAIAILGTLLSECYSADRLFEASWERERERDANGETSNSSCGSVLTAQEKAWALILKAAKILYPGAFSD